MRIIKSYALFESKYERLEKMESDLRELTRQVFELSLEHIDEGGYLGYSMTLPEPHEGLYHEETPRITIAKGMLSSDDQEIKFEYDNVDWVEQSLAEGTKPAVWFYLLTENPDTRFAYLSNLSQSVNFDQEKTEELRERALDELKMEWKGITIWIG